MLENLKINLTSNINGLPASPGVYQFKDKSDNIIYIGKAKNLKKRVKSYFQKKSYRTPKEQSLIKRIDTLEWIVCQDEADAFITEANLIKKHKPKYNVQLKDDKSFPYLKITNEALPKIDVTRTILNDQSTYFGPYTDVKSMRRLVDVLHRAFPIRNCYVELQDKSVVKKGLGLIKISQEEYHEMIEHMILFLKGKTKSVEKKLAKKMDFFSSKLMYEESARVRDQLRAIKSFKTRQRKLEADFSNRDIFGVKSKDDYHVVVILRIQEGRIISREKVSSKTNLPVSELLRSVIVNFYMNSAYIPSKIYFPELPDETEDLQEWLSTLNGKKAQFVVPQRSQKLQEVKLANKNAQLLLNEWLLNLKKRKDYVPKILQELQDIFGLDVSPRLIEAFDISHLGGTDTVASMVVFKDGKPYKSGYRKYNINIEKIDDFESMREVVFRRYKRQLAEKNPLPDLILIDGGKGQLSSAKLSLDKLELNLPIVALAKKLEEVFIPTKKQPLIIAKNSPALNLLKQIRDEAHRFAITFQRSKRTKRMLTK
ncbi:MAG: excinuclease ABC subunit UvrC [Candidatus Neomarinimicrobiota bacterium]|nr:excinuclease ABC subunit UvrC [Candidatus Neomarinimicrobiota bacterium]